MYKLVRYARSAALVLAACAALAGCVVAPAPGYYGGGLVAVAPPEPQVEVVGVPPFAGAVWIGGYWNWTGARHVWVAGRWATPPRPGMHWVPHAWVREGNGWRFRQGRWAR